MIDIDHGSSPDAPVASAPSTQRSPIVMAGGCLVFGPRLLRLDTAADPIRIRKAHATGFADGEQVLRSLCVECLDGSRATPSFFCLADTSVCVLSIVGDEEK